MQRAVESGKFGEEKNAQGGLETAEIKADEDLAVDGLLEAMQRAVEGARPGEEWVVQDEPDTLEIKADEELVRLSLRESSPRSFRTKSLARGLSRQASRRRARQGSSSFR